ncbi:hypothetical protein [Moraxella lacunata]
MTINQHFTKIPCQIRHFGLHLHFYLSNLHQTNLAHSSKCLP